MDDRKQFTMYESMYKALRRIRKKPDRADAYDAICAYALYQTEPDLDSMSDAAAIAFDLIRPVLDSARKKASSGKQGGSKTQANGKQTPREKEGEEEKEEEGEIEGEKEKKQPAILEGRSFTLFWEDYPNKAGRDDAWEAWKSLNPDADTVRAIKAGLDAWKKSGQWLDDGGRYVPSAAKWLRDRRWEIAPPSGKQKVPMGASGRLGEAELEAIQRVLREVDDNAVGTPGNRLD